MPRKKRSSTAKPCAVCGTTSESTGWVITADLATGGLLIRCGDCYDNPTRKDN